MAALTFRRVVKLAVLDDVFFFVVLTVAVDVDLYNNFVLFAVSDLTRVVAQTVLASKERIDAAKGIWNLAFEGYRVIGSASLFSKSCESILRLQKCHPARHTRKAVGCREPIAILLKEKIASSYDIDRNTGVFGDLSDLSVIYLRECVNPGTNQDHGLTPTSQCRKPCVFLG